MRKQRLLAAVLLLLLLPAGALADKFAVVRGGQLNLRASTSTSSQSLGKYSTGSWVVAGNSSISGFREVTTMDGKRGYMMESYLDFGTSVNGGTVKYANGGYVNLRTGPSLNYAVLMRVTSGTTISIERETGDWCYVSVSVNGSIVYGYMLGSLITRASSATAVVTTRNGGKVNVRSGPGTRYGSVGSLQSGTTVTVLLKGDGWYQITGGGLTGFMSTSYLSGTGSTVGTNTGSGTTSSVTAYVNNPRSTQVLNLRESPSQSARSIGQYRNGTQVKVVSYGATWCEVYVGTRHGYMMTSYLSFNGTYLPASTVTPTPVYIYVTPAPTPLVQLVTPTPQSPATPGAGTPGTLAVRAGSSETMISVYYDAALTQLRASYSPGQSMTILQYGDSTCMILVDGGVGYVSTWNVNY